MFKLLVSGLAAKIGVISGRRSTLASLLIGMFNDTLPLLPEAASVPVSLLSPLPWPVFHVTFTSNTTSGSSRIAPRIGKGRK